MNPTAMSLRDPVKRGRGPRTRAAVAVRGPAVLVTGTATGLAPHPTPATSAALTDLSSTVVGLGVSSVPPTSPSALARTGGGR